MRGLRFFGAVTATVVGLSLAVAGPAAGGKPGDPSPPGQERTPPGQAAKEDAKPEKPIPPGQAAKAAAEEIPVAEQPRHDHDSKPAAPQAATPPADEKDKQVGRPSAPRRGQKPAAAAARSAPAHGMSSVAHTHVIICHRTGSASNPYVVINISMSAWLHGHTTHPALNGHNDILLKQGARPGEKMPRSACGSPEKDKPTPPRDKPADVPKSNTPASPPPRKPDDPSTPASPPDVRDPQVVTDSDVAAQVAEAAESGKLPFTGMPLWVAVLAGFWLIGSGLAIRKAFGRPSEEVARSTDQFTW
jgi:hypothetical protein